MNTDLTYVKVLEEKLKYLVDQNEINDTKKKLLETLTKKQLEMESTILFQGSLEDLEKLFEPEILNFDVEKIKLFTEKELGNFIRLLDNIRGTADQQPTIDNLRKCIKDRITILVNNKTF